MASIAGLIFNLNSGPDAVTQITDEAAVAIESPMLALAIEKEFDALKSWGNDDGAVALYEWDTTGEYAVVANDANAQPGEALPSYLVLLTKSFPGAATIYQRLIERLEDDEQENHMVRITALEAALKEQADKEEDTEPDDVTITVTISGLVPVSGTDDEDDNDDLYTRTS